MNSKLNRILCIDDDEDILLVTRMCLQTIGGFNVACCASGMEGIAQALEFKPDIILLDVMMPKMDGPATLKELRKYIELKSIPIVFLTARVQPNEVEDYKKLGGIAVLAKPFDPMTLSKEILNIWEDYDNK